MFVAPNTTTKLQIKLGGAGTVKVQGAYERRFLNERYANGINTVTNGATAVDLVPAPAEGGNVNAIASLTVNNDSGGAVAVTIQSVDSSGPTTRALFTITLATGDQLQMSDKAYEVTDANGNRKSTNTANNTAATTVTSASANALTAGPNGTTNPAFNVDASAATAATGWNLVAAAAASGAALKVASSGGNEVGTIDAKGTSALKLNATSACTGPVQIGGAASGNNATGITVTPAAAASGVAVAAVSSGTDETLKLDAKGAGLLALGDTSTGQTFIGRGALKAPVFAETLTALGTTQSSSPTAAQLLGGVLTQTGATGAGAVTLPTGTAISTAFGRTPAVGDMFQCVFANLGGGQTLTVTGATGSTVVSGGAIATGKAGVLTFINTGANAWSVIVAGG